MTPAIEEALVLARESTERCDDAGRLARALLALAEELARVRPVYEAACAEVDAHGPLNHNDCRRDALATAVATARAGERGR
jgi:hypothetical protein